MTPAQAVDAAILLRARRLVPIHYGLNDPPHYVEVDKPIDALRKITKRRRVPMSHLLPGESLRKW
jgi:L-ascorbate metabolism protein UlaG (beta-lactamase superfamily)